jgi:hypothetical protein
VGFGALFALAAGLPTMLASFLFLLVTPSSHNFVFIVFLGFVQLYFKMSYDRLAFLSLNQVSVKYFCISCANVVYPDCAIKDQAEDCEELVCIVCELVVDKCTNHGHPFTKVLIPSNNKK